MTDLERVKHLKQAYERIRTEISKVIVGQDLVIEELMIGIFARGHCLLEGVPGLAKTLLISTIAETLDMSFKRIQFTPDLMPSDITGTEVIQEDPDTHRREFKFLMGPIFANLVLADEINRTPPKTQAAMLEAMQERRVSIGGKSYPLPKPFFVLATQNPLEQEGTYPLPEAQLDRFLFKIYVDYPEADEELEVMRRASAPAMESPNKVLEAEEVIQLQEIVRRVPVADHVFEYARRLVRMTRPAKGEAPQFVIDWISWGAGPRASINLILAAKARSILYGNYHVSCEDIQAVAASVMRHRIACNFTAQAEGITTDFVIQRLIKEVPVNEKHAAAAK
ncbi:MAG: AAA family ATPase [Planctomycetota bacterium]